MKLATFGNMGVDWEERVRFDRLREERLARISGLLAESEIGALLCFDMVNIRYITATHIGTWAQDKLNRFCLLPQGEPPIMWDFGSAARHHQLYCPWLGEERSRAGISTMRGAMSPGSGRAENVARKIKVELEERGLLGEPVGVDAIEPAVLFALQAEGIQVVDGQQLMQAARVIKTQDEITLLNTACGMVDAAYEELYRAMRPGVPRERVRRRSSTRSSTTWARSSSRASTRSRASAANPHPHVYTDRALRPGDPAYFDILHSFMGYRTCYYRTFAIASASRALVDAYKRCRYYLDAAMALIKPGATTAEVVQVWPEAQRVRLPGRGGRVRAAVRARRRPVDLGEADLLAARVARRPRGDPRGHGLRARDVLAVERRLVGGAHRGAARGHGDRLRGHHALPGRGPAHRGQAVLHGRRARCRSSATGRRTCNTHLDDDAREATPSRRATAAWPATRARPPRCGERGGGDRPARLARTRASATPSCAAATTRWPRSWPSASVEHVVVRGADRTGSAIGWLTRWPVTREAIAVSRRASPTRCSSASTTTSPTRRGSPPRRRSPTSASTPAVTAVSEVAARGAVGRRIGIIGPIGYRAARRAGRASPARSSTCRARTRGCGRSSRPRRSTGSATPRALTDAGVRALAGRRGPGVDERALGDAIERAYVPAGATTHIHYLAATPMDAPRGQRARAVAVGPPAGRRRRAHVRDQRELLGVHGAGAAHVRRRRRAVGPAPRAARRRRRRVRRGRRAPARGRHRGRPRRGLAGHRGRRLHDPRRPRPRLRRRLPAARARLGQPPDRARSPTSRSKPA